MKNKKTPLRMCIACRALKDKVELYRIVKQSGGTVTLNPKAQGRGAYICKEDSCMELCKKKKLLNKAYKMNLDEEIYDKLLEEHAKYKQN